MFLFETIRTERKKNIHQARMLRTRSIKLIIKNHFFIVYKRIIPLRHPAKPRGFIVTAYAGGHRYVCMRAENTAHPPVEIFGNPQITIDAYAVLNKAIEIRIIDK